MALLNFSDYFYKTFSGSIYEKNGRFDDCQTSPRTQTPDVRGPPQPDGPASNGVGQDHLQRTTGNAVRPRRPSRKPAPGSPAHGSTHPKSCIRGQEN